LWTSEEALKLAWLKDIREAIQTFQLRTLLNDNIQESAKAIQEGLVILSATYGVLSSPKKCIDVGGVLQKLVEQNGGTFLELPSGAKVGTHIFVARLASSG
jgi:hypothetical protein